MHFVIFTGLWASTLFQSSSANPACYKNLNNYKPGYLTPKEAFQTILDKAFKELYDKSARDQPLAIEFCGKLDPKENCMRLSAYNDTRCTRMLLKFTLKNKLHTSQCFFPKSKECHIKCHMWIGDLTGTTIYNSGQMFDSKYSWGQPVEAILQIQDVPSAPIAKITSFKYGDQSDSYGFISEVTPQKDKLPKMPCAADVRAAYVDEAFSEEAVREKLVKQ